MRVSRVEFAAAMARADINIKQLSERSGVSRVTITAVKSGKSCSKDTADKLVAVLGQNILEKR